MPSTTEEREYQWHERRFYIGRGAPAGMCWSVREMTSYRTGLDHYGDVELVEITRVRYS